MRYLKFAVFLLSLLLILWWAWQPISDFFNPKSNWEIYLREQRELVGKEDPDLLRWTAVNEQSLRNAIATELPFSEANYFDFYTSSYGSARAYKINLRRGRLLQIDCDRFATGQLFGELYRVGYDDQGPYYDRIDFWQEDLNYQLAYAAKESGELIFLLQSDLDFKGRVSLRVTETPSLSFPVAGVKDRAAQSFWGAERDGGRRKHEGVDIFADKGTELLAVAPGKVTRVKEGGLGGKVVWMRTDQDNLNIYYAHLDKQLVSIGEQVETGDVIGLVGNTGNARTTPPHLHFGIYPGGGKAVDPWPFIDRVEKQISLATENPEWLGQLVEVPARGVYYLRGQPEKKSSVIKRTLKAGETIFYGGVRNGYRIVVTENGERGFVRW